MAGGTLEKVYDWTGPNIYDENASGITGNTDHDTDEGPGWFLGLDRADTFEAGAQEMINQFKSFFEEVEKTPESDAVQQLRKDLEALAQVFQESAKSTQEMIQREVLPELEKQLEDLQRKLRGLGREQEITELKYELYQMQQM